MSDICGTKHQDLDVTCIIRGAVEDHDEHVGVGGIDWPNDDFKPKVRPIVDRKKAKIRLAKIAANAGEKKDKPVLSDPSANNRGAVGADPHDTEVEAAYAVFPNSGTQRLAVLEAIAASGEYGRTDYENDQTIPALSRSSSSTRRIELLKGGWIEDSGRRRKTGNGSKAIVWILTGEGRAGIGRSVLASLEAEFNPNTVRE